MPTSKWIGTLIVLLPVAVLVVMGLSDLKFFWYFSEHYLWYNLGLSLVGLMYVCFGVYVLFPRSKYLVMLGLFLIFTFYQTFQFGWQSPRFIDKYVVSSDSTLVLVNTAVGGATTSEFSANLVQFKSATLFLKEEHLKSYSGIRNLKFVEATSGLLVEGLGGGNQLFKDNISEWAQ